MIGRSFQQVTLYLPHLLSCILRMQLAPLHIAFAESSLVQALLTIKDSWSILGGIGSDGERLCMHTENLVATFQGQPATLFGVARSADDAKVLLKALEVGTDGVVLRTDSPAEVTTVLRISSIIAWANLRNPTPRLVFRSESA